MTATTRSSVRALATRVRRRLVRLCGPRRLRPVLWLGAVPVLVSLSWGVRAFYLADVAPTLYSHEQRGTRMAQRYSETAYGLLEGEGILFPRTRPREGDTALLARPPGYALFVASVYRVWQPGFLRVLLVQSAIGATLPLVVLALGAALFGARVGLIAGVVTALSAPLAFQCAVLTPDSLGTLAAVSALLLFWSRLWRPGPRSLAAGVLLGLAVWLRPNFLLLTPFVALGLFLVSPRRGAAARWLLGSVGLSLLMVAPITLRNWLLYRELVPVSLNLGIVLWEGIADAGGQRFGALGRDHEVAAWEAEQYGNPRYAAWWASPDGIQRDRDRLRRSLAVIRAEPVWFARAALARALLILDYRRGEAPAVEATTPAPPNLKGRRSADEFELLKGLRPSGVLRPPTALAQQAIGNATLPLAVLGLLAACLVSWRRAAFLFLVPAYHLLTQAPIHYEPRFALPMVPFLQILAAVGVCAAIALLSVVGGRLSRLNVRRSGASSTPGPGGS